MITFKEKYMILDLIAYNEAQCTEMQNYVDSNIKESGLTEEQLKMQWIVKFAAAFAVNNRSKFMKAEQAA